MFKYILLDCFPSLNLHTWAWILFVVLLSTVVTMETGAFDGASGWSLTVGGTGRAADVARLLLECVHWALWRHKQVLLFKPKKKSKKCLVLL